jgi:excisionase family DNA binding protein
MQFLAELSGFAEGVNGGIFTFNQKTCRFTTGKLPTGNARIENGIISKVMNDSQERIEFDPNKFYTAKEAADGLNYSYKIVLKWIKSRKLKTSRPAGSRKFLIKGNSILDFVDSNELLTPMLIFKLAAGQMFSHWSPDAS